MIDDLVTVGTAVDKIAKIDKKKLEPCRGVLCVVDNHILEFVQKIQSTVDVADSIDAQTIGYRWASTIYGWAFISKVAGPRKNVLEQFSPHFVRPKEWHSPQNCVVAFMRQTVRDCLTLVAPRETRLHKWLC